MATANKMPDPRYLSLLVNAGFDLIPLHQWDAIGPRNRKVGKAPIGRDWWHSPSMSVGEAADHIATGGNVGIPLGKPIGDYCLCAFDIDRQNLPNDIEDFLRLVPAIAKQLEVELEDLVIHQSGNDGLHIFFLSSEADLRGHIEIDGIKVELKSKGQQVVAPGSVHPDTGQLYEIHPGSASHKKLPIAPQRLIEQFRKPSVTHTGTQIVPPSRLQWIAEQIAKAVSDGVDVFEGYDDWIRGGMAFHAASGGEDYGLDAWISCSHEGEDDHCAYKWTTFGEGEISEKTLNHFLAVLGVDTTEAPGLTADEISEYVANDFAGLSDNEVAPPKPLKNRLLSLDALLALPEPVWLMDHAIPENGLVVLYGPPKSAKTFMALDIALSIGTGKEKVHGFDCQAGRVLYVLAEGGSSMMGNRAKAWMQYHKETSADFAVLDKAVVLPSKQSVDRLLADMKGNDWDLVVVDTLARCMDGDENSVKDMNAAIRGCDYIREKTGAAVLLVHHSGKDQSKGMRGSTALLGAVDGTIRMKVKPDSLIELSVPELRHGEPPEPRLLKLKSTGGSAVLMTTQLAATTESARILEIASRLDDKAPRKELQDALMEEFGIKATKAKKLVSENIFFGKQHAMAVGDVNVWREKDESSSSPNAQRIRIVEAHRHIAFL